MSFESVRDRWVGFLDKLEGRFSELLSQSAVALPQMIDLAGFDPLPFGNALTGVITQSRDIVFRIETTWQEQVEPAFEQAMGDNGTAVIETERQRGVDRRIAMEKKLRKTEVAIQAEGARRMLAEAKTVLASRFACSRCQAPLPVRSQFFRAYHVACQYCQSVNTFEPGMIARNVEHFCAHALAEEAALSDWFRHQDAEQAPDSSDGIASRVHRVKLYTAYVDAYLQAKIDLVPEYAATRDQDRDAKINFYIQSIS
jgi:transcription elongation factor Elf1